MKYYQVREITNDYVCFTDYVGQHQTLSMHDFITQGFLEFFHKNDANLIVERSKLSAQGQVLSRLDKYQMWVPYHRYKYLPFFLFIVLGTQFISPYLSTQHIQICGCNYFGSFLVLPFAFISTDLINELYGYQTTKRMIRYCSALLMISAFFIFLILKIINTEMNLHNKYWCLVSRKIPSLLTFYSISLLISDMFNAWLFYKIRFFLSNKGFWFRSVISTTISRTLYSLITIILLHVTGNLVKYKSFNLDTFKIIFSNLTIGISFVILLIPGMYFICRKIKENYFKIPIKSQYHSY